ncbi:MAG: phosphoglycerate kinase, partial [Candidatus Limnocylindria bacterium]
ERLSELLDGAEVKLAEDLDHVPDGEIVMLENVRFEKGETKNDPELAKRYAALADAYVNDAFGAAHRAHASTEAVARVLPAYAGLLLERELRVLGGLLADPARPFLAIVGGAKVSSKIGVLRALVEKADALAIGGGMANTFLSATGHGVGRSLRETDREGEARAILERAKARGTDVLLPGDVVTAPSVDESGAAAAEVHGIDEVPAQHAIVDVGPRTLEAIARAVASAGTIFWNGPLGVFEIAAFAKGTRRVAQLLADAPRHVVTVVGGGESVQAVRSLGLAARMTHLSTGGGAALELVEGKALPGVEAIPDRDLAGPPGDPSPLGRAPRDLAGPPGEEQRA